MLEYIYAVRLYLFIKFVIFIFYISKASIGRKINKHQKQNSMGKILIYLDKEDVLLIKSSKFSIPKSFSMSFVWNIW